MNKKIFFTPTEILKKFQNANLPSNFCLVPFTNIIFNPGGQISVCRQKGTDHAIGNLKNQTLAEIWNSDYMKSWREEFLTGNVKICSKEQARDACHLWSSNYHFFDNVVFQTEMPTGVPKITANLNGKCNLRCKMCHIWKMENGAYDNLQFWPMAEREFFPYIKEIEFLSGEPFIQKDTFSFIERIYKVNPECQWSFTTNAHWKLNKNLTEILNKIRIKNIIISLDSLSETKFSEIRSGGSLKILMNTLLDLKAYEQERKSNNLSPLGLTIHFTAMRSNFLEALQIVEFCRIHQIRHSFKTLLTPEDLSVLTLPYEERLRLAENFIEIGSKDQLIKAMKVLRPLLETLDKFDRAFLLNSIVLKTEMDQRL